MKLGKSDFIGAAALKAEKERGPARKIVFFKTGDRRIVRAGTPVLGPLGEVGQVASGTLSPILNEAIGSALIAASAVTEPLAVDIRGARIDLHLVRPPFVPLAKK
ncbi:MAG: glycine cleavage T C-terminal barrel domain-containing protein [Alphaproteobacteria bacterium]|nr:glycine cleavage T C-terminal barrel domain-containing protein [Alphaproteobacteria bacterium]